jgi:hypothetical protein
MGDMVAPLCSTVCGAQSAAAVAAAIAAESGCCPVRCATAFTEGDTLSTVPEFDIPVEDGQLVEVTVTGYVIRTDANSGTQGGFVYMRAMARRYDADGTFPGLEVLFMNFDLQAVSAGLGIQLVENGNTLQVQLDGAAGMYRWDLEMSYCVKDQIVDASGGG